MKKILISIVLLIFLSCKVDNNNNGELVVSGEYIDGNTITICGSGFGSHSLDIEWLGGKGGPIETGTVGDDFNKDNWDNGLMKAQYDNTIAYSNSKSIIFDSTINNDGRFRLSYDPGSEITLKTYITWMAYIDKNGVQDGQWKMFRLNHENNVEDTKPEITLFNWFGRNHGKTLFVRREKGEIEQRYYLNDQYPALGENVMPSDKEWVRIELIIEPSSSPGSNDASFEYIVHHPNSGSNPRIDKVFKKDDLISYSENELKKWRYYVFQTYQGNGFEGKSKVWLDDIYIQNSIARVEIGNKPKWDDCTRRDIQYILSWSNSLIEFELNKGGFKNSETGYLFVVTSGGTVIETNKEVTFK